VSRGLSTGQRRALGILVAAGQPMHVTGALGPLVGMPKTPSGRRALISAMRSLEHRGLVTIQARPRKTGGKSLYVTARPGAAGVISGADLQRGHASLIGWQE